MLKVKDTIIEVIRGDITELPVDAIVLPVSEEGKFESGLTKFIEESAGYSVEQEVRRQGRLELGRALCVPGGDLKPKSLILAVVLDGAGKTHEDWIRCAAGAALRCAQSRLMRSIAFSALGCGAGHFPLAGSAKIITQEILKYLRGTNTSLREITFCHFNQQIFDAFSSTVTGYIRHMTGEISNGPYVTVDMIIEQPDGIVLIERSNPPYGWALPGGFVDYGESLEEAARREAKEETNLEFVNMRQFHTYSRPGRDPRFHTVSTVFIGQGQGVPRSGDDAASLKIVRYEDLPTLDYAFDHKEIIKEYLMEREMDGI